MDFQTQNFLDILESEGIKFLRNDSIDDVHLRFYESKNGFPIPIDCSEDEITHNQGKGYLQQLGCEDLIPAMFPDVIATTATPIEEEE